MAGIVALLAHPDDEFFCAGLLAALASRGVPVHLVYWTRGEGGLSRKRRLFWKCFPRGWHPRVWEARRAAGILGAPLEFLGSVDPAPSPMMRAPGDDPQVLKEKLNRLFCRLDPEMVVTHGSDGDYGHPAHVRLHQMIGELAGESWTCPWIIFNASWSGAPEVFFLNKSDPADYVFDSRPLLRKKVALVRTHRSQRFAFEAMAQNQGESLRQLFRISRFEGYRCRGSGEQRDAALEKLGRWMGKTPSS